MNLKKIKICELKINNVVDLSSNIVLSELLNNSKIHCQVAKITKINEQIVEIFYNNFGCVRYNCNDYIFIINQIKK